MYHGWFSLLAQQPFCASDVWMKFCVWALHSELKYVVYYDTWQCSNECRVSEISVPIEKFFILRNVKFA